MSNTLSVILGSLMALGLAMPAAAAAAPTELFPNADFETPLDGLPAGVTYETEKKNHFIRITANPAAMVMLYKEVNVSGLKLVQIAYRERHHGVVAGAQSWNSAVVMIDFKDADHKSVPGATPPPHFSGTSDDWNDQCTAVAVPDGATYLAVMPTMFNAAAGTFDIDDLHITAVDTTQKH